MEIIKYLIVPIYGLLCLFIGYSMRNSKKKKSAKRLKTDIPNCRCTDPNECDTWCIAKENFSRYHG